MPDAPTRASTPTHASNPTHASPPTYASVPTRGSAPIRVGALTRASVLAGRSVRISRRNVDALITSIVLPVMLMLTFVVFFGGAIDTGSSTTYVTYVVPGVLLLCAGFGSASTAVSVSEDMKTGIVDRFRALDIGGVPLLAGHVAASVARNLLATAIVLAVALAIGFRPSAGPAGWATAVVLLTAWIVAVSWLSAAAGLLARTPEAANGYTFFMMFLPYPSSAFVPVTTMPTWLHGFAEHQPVTPMIESLRALLLGRPAGGTPWVALAWCGGILAVAMLLTGVLFRRRTG